MKKYVAALLILIAILTIVPSAVFASPVDTDADTEGQQAEYIEMVNEAISVLADTWNDEYWTEDYPESRYLKILQPM